MPEWTPRLEANVLLDFDGVDSIGQAFADEIFRVYALKHPEISMYAIRANKEVDQMIRRATADYERERAKDEGGRRV